MLNLERPNNFLSNKICSFVEINNLIINCRFLTNWIEHLDIINLV